MHLRFSQDLKALLTKLNQQPLTLADILSETSERGFSLVITLLVLPFLFPMPPGLTTPLGLGCLLLSLQMALGRRSPWLPQRVAKLRFPQQVSGRLLRSLQGITRILERITRPRLAVVAENPLTWQINGLCISWLALLLMAPIPFTNPIPTTGILLFTVAMLEADGLLMFVGYVLTTVITLLCGVGVYLLWRSPELLQNLFQ